MREGVRGVGVGRGAYNLTKKGFLNKLLNDADQILFEFTRLFKLQSVAKYRIFFNTSYRGIPGGGSYPDVFFVCLQGEWACNWKGL